MKISRQFALFCCRRSNMAYVLSQLPVHCGPVPLLKEPDVIPSFRYLFDRELGPTRPEDSEKMSDRKPQVERGEQEIVVEVIPCEDPGITSDINQHNEEVIDIVTFEDITDVFPDDAHMESRTGMDHASATCKDITYAYLDNSLKESLCGEDVPTCMPSMDSRDVYTVDAHMGEHTGKDTPDSSKGIADVYPVDTHTEEHTGKDTPNPCKDKTDVFPHAASTDVVIPPVSCIEDTEEPLILPDGPVASPRQKPEMKLFIPLKKLRVATNCLNKKPELEEDEYIFCSKCEKLQIGVCSIHCNLKWVKEPSVVPVTGGLTKARATIPENMDLKASSIPDAGLGIFAKKRFESDVVFGPYWGQKISVADVTPNMDQGYMWDIIENGQVTHVVDARDEEHSNWLRFVNCARNEDEQNLVAFQYRGEIYYRSYKVIEPGMELLVWYGDRYACDLDILDKDKKPEDGPIQCQKCKMICWGPISLASHNKFRCQMNNEHHLWRCMHCDRSFKTQASLHLHKNIHKGLKPFTCKICGKAFSHRGSRKRHYALHNGVVRESVHCKTCGKVFIDRKSLNTHVRKFHFATIKDLNQHKKLHAKPETFSCKTCGKLFKNKVYHLRHEALHKKNAAVRKCQHCGRRFDSGVALANHMRSHNNAQNVCSICNVSFTYSFNLARHMREKHPKVKVLKCGRCSKVCPDRRRLALHIAIGCFKRIERNQGFSNVSKHPKKRISMADSVKCNKCKLTLPKRKFYDHMRIHHKARAIHSKKPMNSSGDKRQISTNHPKSRFVGTDIGTKCEFCQRVFRTKQLMYCHRAAHFRKVNPSLPAVPSGVQSTVLPSESKDHTESSGEEFRCEICDKEFPSLKAMQNHKGIHLRKWRPSKLIPCGRCNRSFTSQKGLRWHQCNQVLQNSVPGWSTIKHTGRFRCRVCHKSFRTERSLRSHKTHHSRARVPSDSFTNSSLKHSHETAESQAGNTEGKDFCEEVGSTKSSHLKNYHCDRSKGLFGHSMQKKHFSSGLLSQEQKHLRGQGSNSPSVAPSNKIPFSARDHELFRCKECGKKFHSKAARDTHKGHHRRASSLKIFNAHHFANANVRSKTIVDVNTPKRYECSTCLELFKTRSSLTFHARRSHVGINATFICPFCDKTFSTKRRLLEHKQRFHSTDDPFTCLHCNGQFSTKYSRNNHACHVEVAEETIEEKEVEVKEETSVELNVGFKSNPTVDGSTEEPHACNICFESFQSNRSLLNHKRSHAGISSPFVCSICNRGLSSKRSLFRHKESQHRTTKKFSCLPCNKQFLSYSGFRKHKRKKHAESKPDSAQSVQTNSSSKLNRQQVCKPEAKGNAGPWHCQYCERKFGTIKGIATHLWRTHPGRKEFDGQHVCDPEVTADDFSLDNVDTESSKRTVGAFRCQYCQKGFSTVHGRYKHIMIAHGTELISIPPAPPKSSETQSASGHNVNIPPASLAQHESREVFKNCNKVHRPASDYNPRLSVATSKSIKIPRREKVKRSILGCRLSCCFCRKQFFNKSSRRKHELYVHERRVGSSSTLRKHKNGRTNNKNLDDMTAFSSEEQLPVSQNRDVLADTIPSADGFHAKAASALNCQPTDKVFPCQYCPRQFFRVSDRYKHTALAHSGDASSSSKVCHLDSEVSSGNVTTKTGETVSADQPLTKRFKPQELAHLTSEKGINSAYCRATPPSRKQTSVRTKAFQCKFCSKSFSACSLRYRHFLLVHSRSCVLAEQTSQADKPSVTSLPHATSNDNLKGSFVSQSKMIESQTSIPGRCSKAVSVCEGDLQTFTCRICSMFFLTRGEWVSHFKENHSNAGKAMRGICRSPSRPALRTISAPFNSNSLTRLRDRHATRTKVARSKKVSSSCGRKVLKPVSSMRPPTKAKKFRCDICFSLFSQRLSVERHKKTVHCDEKPFRCKMCGFACKREDYLPRHYRSHFKGQN